MATIAENLERIQSAKNSIKAAIEAKGVTVPSSATIDTYDDYVSQISGGGGGTSYENELKGIIDRSITSIEIPSGITYVGQYSFYGCQSLTDVIIPSGVEIIHFGAFQNCISLSSVTMPNSVTIISDYAFATCRTLSDITISEGVTVIGGNAFRGCALPTLTIPSTVTGIGASAFNGCSSLTSITINVTTPPTLSNVNAFSNTNGCPIYVPAESVDTYKAANVWSSLSSRIQAIPTT